MTYDTRVPLGLLVRSCLLCALDGLHNRVLLDLGLPQRKNHVPFDARRQRLHAPRARAHPREVTVDHLAVRRPLDPP